MTGMMTLSKLHSPKKSWYSYSLSLPYFACNLIKETESHIGPPDII